MSAMSSILIIDDEDSYLELCKRYLPEHNFLPPARNYREAAEILRRLGDYEPRQPLVDGLTFHEGLKAVAISGGIAGVIPVGQAFLRAVRDGLATRDMYAKGAETDGLIDLWFNDGTHASVHGSYLSPLTLFGSITGLDPQSLGRHEQAAFDLGISPDDAWALQRVAALELGFAAAVPEPGQAVLLAAGLLGLAGWRRARGRQGR